MTNKHEPGIYFGMSAEEYHADPALGSGSLKRLLASGPDWWWHSELNPARPEKDEEKAHLNFGKAVHAMVLEGKAAFDARFIPQPDPEGLIDTVKQMDAFILENESRLPAADKAWKTKDKAWKAEVIRKMDPSARVLMHIEATAQRDGKVILPRESYNRIVTAGTSITANPALAQAFNGGVSEVSVFWEHTMEDGMVIPCKCRFDYLKVRAIGDLKSTRNMYGLPFPQACRRAIATYRYDVQAAHYMEGRSLLRPLVEAGKVFGEHDPEWLAKVAESDEAAFVFVFFQSVDAPVTWACSLSPGNPVLDYGRMSADMALRTYSDFMRRYGTDAAWVLEGPISELDINELPGFFGR